MITDISIFNNLLLLVVLIAGGFIFGIIFEKVIFRKIKRISEKTKWEIDDIFIHAFRGTIILIFIIASIYLALNIIKINQEKIVFVHKFLLIIVIFLVTVVVSRIAVGFVNLYSRRAGGVFTSTSMFTNMTRLFVYIIGILIILQSLGISITPILTALGVGGLAVALALQDTLSNLFAGMHVIASGQIKPGHYIKLSSTEEGIVTDITWRYTTIRSMQNNTVIVPNSKLASAIVTNYNTPDEEIPVSVEIGVSYNSNLEMVERVTIETAKEVMQEINGGVPDYEPNLRYNKFDDSTINLTITLRAKKFVDQYAIKHELIKRLHKRYGKEGIDIPYPARIVYIKDRH